MTIQTATIATAPKQRTTRFITAAAGAVLALSAAAGIGAWQASRDGSTSVGNQPAASMPATAARVPAVDPAAFSDQELYSRWLPAQAAAVQVPDPAAFSDQEMYQRSRHAAAAPAVPVTDQAMYQAWQAAARTGAAPMEPMGGLAELYAEREADRFADERPQPRRLVGVGVN